MCWLTLVLTIVAPVLHAQQEKSLFVFQTGHAVHLRWNAPLEREFEGFVVERRRDQGQWQALHDEPITPLADVAEIERVLGAQAGALLGFFRPDSQRLDVEDWQRLARSPEDLSLLRLLSVQQPAMAQATGERYSDTHLQPGQTFDYRVVLLDSSGRHPWAMRSGIAHGQPDQVPIPEGFSGEGGDGVANLAWQVDPTRSADGSIVGYRVYRGESHDARFEPAHAQPIVPMRINGQLPEFLFVDVGLENGKPYLYELRAVNLLGFEGPATERIEIKPRDLEPPPAPELQASMMADSLLLEWTSVEVDDLAGYRIYRALNDADAERVWPAAGLARNATSLIIDELSEGVDLRYFVTAVDASGNESPLSNVIELFRPDETPPAAPTNLSATAGSDGIALEWSANSELDLLGYLVQRTTRVGADERVDGGFFAEHAAPLTDTHWLDPVPETSQARYAYRVVAVDRAGNESQPSDFVVASMPDTVPPAAPVLTRIEQSDQTVRLEWLAPPDPDLAGFRIHAGGIGQSPGIVGELDDPESSEFEYHPDQTGVMLTHSITALDTAGNESEPSAPMQILVLDLTGPPPPKLDGERREGEAHLEWSYPEKEERIGYQLLFRSDDAKAEPEFLVQIDAGRRGFVDTDLDPERDWIYVLRAVDTNDNLGPESNRLLLAQEDGSEQ